ncbi:MAG: hypothetical protein AMXMBFR49_17320 [Chlorobiota bacterium]
MVSEGDYQGKLPGVFDVGAHFSNPVKFKQGRDEHKVAINTTCDFRIFMITKVSIYKVLDS